MAPTVEHQVRLYRESQAVAWGFKLQGGLEYRVPLTVQRVFVGSPADGALHRGDVIVAIDNYDSSQMLYRQAMDLVKRASNSLIVRLRRAQSIKGVPASPAFKPTHQASQAVPYRSQTLDSRVHRKPHSQQAAGGRPRSMEYDYNYDDYSVSGDYVPASDYSVDELSGHLQQQTFWGEEQDSQDPEYEQRSVDQLKQLFGKHPQYSSYTLPARRNVNAPHRSFAPHSVQGSGLSKRPAWHKPNVSSNPAPDYLLEPGWAPKSPKGQQVSPWVQKQQVSHSQQQMSPGRSGQQQMSPSRSAHPQVSPGRHHHAGLPYIQSPPLRQYQAQEETEMADYSQQWAEPVMSPRANNVYNQPHSYDQDNDYRDYRSEDGWDSEYQHHMQPVARQPQTYQQPRGQYQQPQPINKIQPHHVHKPQPINNMHKPQPTNNMIKQPAYKNPHTQFNKPQQQPVNKPQQHVNKPQPVYKQQQQPAQGSAQQQKPAYKPQPTVTKQQPVTNNSKSHEQHYNNPGNLYSQKNSAPNQYKPNKGNIVVTGVTSAKKSFNLAQSDVFRLVSEEQEAQKDSTNQQRAFPFANYTDRDESGFAESGKQQQATYRPGGALKQTPLLYELNQQYSVDDVGISDF